MDRSRSKRNYYYDQDFDSETLGRSNNKPRYNHHYTNTNNNSNNGHHYRRGGVGGGGGGGGGRSAKLQDAPATVTTSYRILCHDMKAGGVIGKSGSIIKSIRQHTGAWINVHELILGDEERIIEISDTRRRDPDGRMPAFSPAQEALLLIHERMLESDGGFGMGYGGGGDEDEEYGPRGGVNRVATRLVVSRMHVGSLLGKGGKIIEQMRIETKTQIRVLPRDHTLPRCVSMSEEIVQVVGDINAVKNAIALISSRLRESQHRDRSHHGRVHSPDEDFIPHPNNTPRRSSMDGPPFGPRFSSGVANNRNNNYASRPSTYNIDSGLAPMAEDAQMSFGEGIVFRLLCPIDKVDYVFGESNGIIELLRDEIGVDVTVTDPLANSDERIIMISSEEGPDDEMFPAQEALLHIQTRIVDFAPDKENIITTKLLIPSSEIRCLEGKDGPFSEMRLSGANIQILPREQLPGFMSGTDEIVQITGEIEAARSAVVELTSRLRSYIYREFFQKDLLPPPPPPPPPLSALGPVNGALGLEAPPNNITSPREGDFRNDQPTVIHQNVAVTSAVQPVKVSIGPGNETAKQNETDRREIMPSVPNRFPVSLVTRSILEVVLPEHAVPKLITKSKNKLAQISELSGANVKLVEDGPDATERIIHISGTPEQAERAQSLLQGFILSTQEDGP